MCARSGEFKFVVVVDPIDQEPVWLDMAFPPANPVSRELVWPMPGLQRQVGSQPVHDIGEQVFVISAFCYAPQITAQP